MTAPLTEARVRELLARLRRSAVEPYPMILTIEEHDTAIAVAESWLLAQWIPVGERLPEEGARVEISYDGRVAIGAMSQSPTRFVIDEKPFYGVWIAEVACDQDEGPTYCWPTHWREIEPPPNQEKARSARRR